MPNLAPRALRALARLYLSYEPGAEAEKLRWLDVLAREALPTAGEVSRLHEILCFLRAYPDGPALLALVEVMLGAFARRPDLRRHRRALEDSGIAGTVLRFRFFGPAAARLAERWGSRLTIDWALFENAERLRKLLPLLLLPAERSAADLPLPVRTWLRRLCSPGETDAVFLLRRFGRLAPDSFTRDTLYDNLDPALRLAPGPDTPARTREKFPLPIVYRDRPLSKARPDLASELGRPPARVRDVPRREAEALIELARDSMLPRERDLEVFSYASPEDVRLALHEDGLSFACIGVLPERRSLLEAVYALLTLQNGVAVGYALCSALFRSSEVAYNVFETFRGGESARVFGRLLATVHHLFGSDSFMIDPYQLGHGNEEGIRSGAFWFYQKLGFRPRHPRVVAALEGELAEMRATPGYRSPARTLRTLASAPVFWQPGPPRDDVIGVLSLPAAAERASRFLAERHGADRERALRECLREAAARVGLDPAEPRRWPAGERQAWERWAPQVALFPGVERWNERDRRRLVEVVRAKGGVRESDYLRRFESHRRLRAAVRDLLRADVTPPSR